ncbi:MAG: hypothetical protein ACK4J0_02740 [Candidatus Anstonellaceae archaeon]
MTDYLKNFPAKKNLPKTDTGIFIVDKTILKKFNNGSLNIKNKEEVESNGYKIGFISFDFLLRLYEISKENTFFINKNLLKKEIIGYLNKSVNFRNVDDLEKTENKVIKSIEKHINKGKKEYLRTKKERKL